MKEVRKRIDKIDSQILPLMVKRSQLVNRALSLKTRKSEIIDSKRINEIKKKVSSQAKKLGANPKLISDICKLLPIDQFGDYGAARMEIDGMPNEEGDVHIAVRKILEKV